MPLPTTAPVLRMFSIGRTRPARFGRTRHTGRRRIRRCCRGAGSYLAFIERSQRVSQCPNQCGSRMHASRKSAQRSSTSSRIKRDPWGWLCERSGSRGRKLKSARRTSPTTCAALSGYPENMPQREPEEPQGVA